MQLSLFFAEWTSRGLPLQAWARRGYTTIHYLICMHAWRQLVKRFLQWHSMVGQCYQLFLLWCRTHLQQIAACNSSLQLGILNDWPRAPLDRPKISKNHVQQPHSRKVCFLREYVKKVLWRVGGEEWGGETNFTSPRRFAQVAFSRPFQAIEEGIVEQKPGH